MKQQEQKAKRKPVVRSKKAVDAELKQRLMERQAIDLRMRGFNFDQMGDEMGLSRSQAHRYYVAAMARLKTECVETTEEHLATMLRQLDSMIMGLQPYAEGKVVEEEEMDKDGKPTGKIIRVIQPANPKFTDQLNKVLAQKAQLLGLNNKDNKPANVPLPWNDDE